MRPLQLPTVNGGAIDDLGKEDTERVRRMGMKRVRFMRPPMNKRSKNRDRKVAPTRARCPRIKSGAGSRDCRQRWQRYDGIIVSEEGRKSQREKNAGKHGSTGEGEKRTGVRFRVEPDHRRTFRTGWTCRTYRTYRPSQGYPHPNPLPSRNEFPETHSGQAGTA